MTYLERKQWTSDAAALMCERINAGLVNETNVHEHWEQCKALAGKDNTPIDKADLALIL